MSLSKFDLAGSGYEQDLAAVRSTLDETAFHAAWAEGRSMSFERAIAYALEGPTAADDVVRAEVVSPARTPAKRPTDDEVERRHNLPAERSGFVGREREIVEVKRALSMTRLLTITGAGGCGKTRLALEVAGDLKGDAYPDGVWLVELAPLYDGELVAGAVVSALGVSEQPGLSPTDTLVDYLRSRRTLLVLDNCELVIESCAELVDTLLGACEDLRVLATSREPLRVAGETNWVAPSLTVPKAGPLNDAEDLERYESVRLFVERARSRVRGFTLTRENAGAVADLCRRLDGIPLAIELATARIGALSVEQISSRLENSLGFLTTGERTRAPRQRTLRAALQWSYEPEAPLTKAKSSISYRRSWTSRWCLPRPPGTARRATVCWRPFASTRPKSSHRAKRKPSGNVTPSSSWS